MFKSLKNIRRSWNEFVKYDAETEALNGASDRIDVEMIHRSFAKNARRNPYGY